MAPVGNFFKNILFIYLFLAELGLRCVAQAPGRVGSVVAAPGLSSCGPRAQ